MFLLWFFFFFFTLFFFVFFFFPWIWTYRRRGGFCIDANGRQGEDESAVERGGGAAWEVGDEVWGCEQEGAAGAVVGVGLGKGGGGGLGGGRHFGGGAFFC